MVAVWLAVWRVVAVRWASMTLVDDVRDVYRARWGEPSRRAFFEVAGLEVEVLKWDADITPEGVAMYATVGASAFSMAGRDPSHRVEFFVGLLPEQDDVASPLAALALYSVRQHVAVGHGDTVSAGEPLWRGTDMQWFLVLRPLEEIIPTLELPEGLHVEFLQAIPIFENELAFKAARGADMLLRRWESAMTPFWDPRRAPAALSH